MNVLKLINNSQNKYDIEKSENSFEYFGVKSDKSVILFPEEFQIIPTGIQLEIPKGYYLEVKDTPSLLTRGVKVHNTIYFYDYTGEVYIILTNTNKGEQIGENAFKIKSGDKIANLFLQKSETFIITQ